MPQTVILNKFIRYLDIVSGEERARQKKELDPQAYAKFKKAHKAHINALKKDLAEGHCFGFSVCHAAMDYAGKLEWWQNVLMQLNNWDEQPKSLEDTLKIPGADGDKTVTRHELFERAMNYVIISQSSLKTTKGFLVTDVNQTNILQPGSNFFELIVEENEKNKIDTIQEQKSIAGNFTETDLDKLLDEKTIHNSICIVHSDVHTIRVAYDGKKWILYDPNFPHGNLEEMQFHGDKKAVIAQIFLRLKTHSIGIQVASFANKKLDFPDYEQLLTKDTTRLLEKQGLHMIARYSPDTLSLVFDMARKEENQELRSAIAEALVEKNQDGWTGLHVIANYSPENLASLFDMAMEEENQALRSAIAETFVEKTKDGWTALHVIANYSPENLALLFDMAMKEENQALRSAIAKALVEKNQDGWTGLGMIVNKEGSITSPLGNILIPVISGIVLDALPDYLNMNHKDELSFFEIEKKDNINRAQFYQKYLRSQTSDFGREVMLYAFFASELGKDLQQSIAKKVFDLLGVSSSNPIETLIDLLKKDMFENCMQAAGDDKNKFEEYRKILDKFVNGVVVSAYKDARISKEISEEARYRFDLLERMVYVDKNLIPDIIDSLQSINDQNHEGLIKLHDIANDTRENKWSCIIKECQYRSSDYKSATSHFSFFGTIHERHPRADLLYHAIAQFEENILFDNRIASLEELMVVQQKREVIEYLTEEIKRLKPDIKNNNAESTGDIAYYKVEAYKIIIDYIMHSYVKKDVHEILNKDIKEIGLDVINNHGRLVRMSLDDILRTNQRWERYNETTSGDKLDKMIDHLRETDPHRLVFVKPISSPYITKR